VQIIPVILCGGVGSRLWPLSRELRPKPFIQLSDGQSLLQKAFLRSAALPHAAEILTVTNRDLFFQTEEEFRAVNASQLATSFILEPFGRNTAPAIAVAALHIERAYGKDAIMLVLPADHLITDQSAFAQAVIIAADCAIKGKLVTFGIKPDNPETAYGYIEAEDNKVLRFVEKPTLIEASEYVQSGRYLWNSGMFCFSAGTILQAMEKYCAHVLIATTDCFNISQQNQSKDFKPLLLDPASFQQVPDISIDYAVMEKSDQLFVVPCDIGWKDIGSWDALGNLTPPDVQGNRVKGKAVLQDTSNCYVHSEERMVGVVGAEDLIIIDTPDVVLVANRTHAQDIKHMYAQLKTQGHESYKFPRTVYRPWGSYTVLEEGVGYKIKHIEVKAGASLSLQMHQHRSEHWVVVSGTAKVVSGDNEFLLTANESTYIPIAYKHRLSNPTDKPIVIIEVQSGDYIGEDDIIRFNDYYS